MPLNQVKAINTDLDWANLAALPEMLQTAYGSLYNALQLKKGESLLVRGGTSSVGLAAAAIANHYGSEVYATTRNSDKLQFILDNGASHVVIDDGKIAENVKQLSSGGVDKVLELVGTTTLLDSIACTRHHGITCMTGMLGFSWELENFSPMGAIPTAQYLTSYSGGEEDFMNTPLQELVEMIEKEELLVKVGKTFTLDQIVEAHQCLETNQSQGKIVLVMS